ncbi:hypothetical protein SDC9_182291 [bioreactor metagenome]|uniref:Uncharacterized protein n=1 Tax=bioreactor metagenome TaxID=1076179 RepID=A0A645H6Y4_9ZZZZ
MLAARVESTARRGAPVVFKHGAALGQHGLLKVVFGHLPAHPAEKLPNALGGGLIEHQLLAKGLCQHVFGQIVAGGAKAAGGDDNVRPALGNVHSGPQSGGVVPHHGVVKDVDAQGGKLPGEHLRVGVGDVAQQQLGAYGDEFGGVCHGCRTTLST